MASKIEDMIVELQDYIDSCKSRTFKSDEIIVNRDDIESYIEDLRANIPDEIRQYQRIINNQEHILADARKKADAIIKEAEIETDKLVSEHQIMTQAYAKANELVFVASKEAESILDKANTEANEIKGSAMEYTDTNLKIIQEIIMASMETTKSKADSYMNQMQGYLNTIVSNRNDLAPIIATLYGGPVDTATQAEEVPIEAVNTATGEAGNANGSAVSENASATTQAASTGNANTAGTDTTASAGAGAATTGSGTANVNAGAGSTNKATNSGNKTNIDVPDVFFNKD